MQYLRISINAIDATRGLEKQDLTIADLAAREGRAFVIGLGKWDLIEDKGALLTKLREDAERLLPQVRGCPVVPVSGATGQGLDRLMEAIVATHVVWNKRIATARPQQLQIAGHQGACGTPHHARLLPSSSSRVRTGGAA